MAVLRVGFPGLEDAVKYVFYSMREEEIVSLPISFTSKSLLVPRVSASVDRIRDVLFKGILPIEGKKIITIDDLMEFELVESGFYIFIEVNRSFSGLFAAYSYLYHPRIGLDWEVGSFFEQTLSNSCKVYDSITSVFPLDLSNEEDERLEGIKDMIFRTVSDMISVANLLYSLYNLDSISKFDITNPYHLPDDEEKVRKVAKIVKEAGDSFQEAVVNLSILKRYIYG
jgi:hypothetical protein